MLRSSLCYLGAIACRADLELLKLARAAGSTTLAHLDTTCTARRAGILLVTLVVTLLAVIQDYLNCAFAAGVGTRVNLQHRHRAKTCC
jgi:hypothetical protein